MSVWAVKKLGEVTNFKGGGTPSKEQPKFWVGSIPWVSPKDMKHDIISDSRDHISEEALSASPANLIPIDSTLIVVRSGILARTIPLGVTSVPLTVNQDIKAICPSNKLNPRFLYLCLQSNERKILASVTKGATVHRLNTDFLKALPIPVPPLAEQKRIVAILDEAFEGLATATAHTERKLKNARDLFQSTLQAAFGGNGELRMENGEWLETTLGASLINQPRNGWSPPAKNHSDSGTPVLTLSSVTGFEFRLKKFKYTSAKTEPSRHYWVENGDLLLTRSNTPELVGHVAIAEGIQEPTIYPDLIMRMNPDPKKAVTKFLYWHLRTPELREEITGRASGANPTMKKLNKAAVQTLPISLPPLPEQRAIVEKLDQLSAQTRQLEALYQRQLTAYTELKQSLLHQAFSAKL